MRIDGDQPLGFRQVHGLHHVEHARPPFALAEFGVDVEHFGDLVADFHDRIECGHRLLEDHRNAVAADAPHLGGRFLQEIIAFEQRASRRGSELAWRQQAHHGMRGD